MSATPNGQALVYIYSRESEADAIQAKVLTKDEPRRIAVNVARLPELLGKRDGDDIGAAQTGRSSLANGTTDSRDIGSAREPFS